MLSYLQSTPTFLILAFLSSHYRRFSRVLVVICWESRSGAVMFPVCIVQRWAFL